MAVSKLAVFLKSNLKSHYKLHCSDIQLRPWNYEDTRAFDEQFVCPTISMSQLKTGGRGYQRVPIKSPRDILQHGIPGVRPTRIVCLGDPGSGKSTVLEKMVFDWMSDDFQGIQFMFLLRMNVMNETSSIGHAITSQLLNSKCSSDRIEEFIEENQEKCAILLDGYDEGHLRLNEANGNVAKILRNEKYPDCLVVVTSRSEYEYDFIGTRNMSRTYTKVRIEGFKETQNEEYIDKYFASNTVLAETLKSYLKGNFVLRELTPVPFFCMVECILWEVNGLADAAIYTDLFQKLIDYLCVKCASKGMFRQSETGIGQVSTIYRKFGKVALSKLHKSSCNIEITEDDLRGSGLQDEEVRTICDVGLVTKYESMLDDIPKGGGNLTRTSYTFFHSMAMKHCASLYLMGDEHGLSILRGFLDSTVTSKESVRDYMMFLQFISGCSPDACLLILHHILKYWPQRSRSELHYTVLSLVAECREDTTIDRISECVNGCFEDGTLHLKSVNMHHISGLCKLRESSLRGIGKLIIRSFYLHSTHTKNLLKKLPFLQEIRMVWSTFPSDLPVVPTVKLINVDYMRDTRSYVNVLAIVPRALSIVIGFGQHCREEVMSHIAVGIQSSDAAKSNDIQWRELTLDGSAARGVVTTRTGDKLAAELAKHVTELEVLDLCRIDMEEGGLISIVKMCQKMKNMKEIMIGLCGSTVQGELHSFLFRNQQATEDQTDIILNVFHSADYGAKVARSYRIGRTSTRVPPSPEKRKSKKRKLNSQSTGS